MLEGSNKIKGTEITEVQAINALANYFKHYEDWPFDWTKGKVKRQKDTIDILKELGITSRGTGNLRTGSEKLGNSNYYNLKKLSKALEKWSKYIKNSFTKILDTN
ncbi:MAG: hypothetical protein A2167_01800 [Planctomycetes bacterium RBG_13_46_10]|nr:MAG: hypothetical protein A2167_01800 [Planctomycetes bacterium RBG_13_46_10]QBM02882.1 hypothetical protein [uncultured archaeon]